MTQRNANVVEILECAALGDYSLHAVRLDGAPGVALVLRRRSRGYPDHFVVRVLVDEGEARLGARLWLVHTLGPIGDPAAVLGMLPSGSGRLPEREVGRFIACLAGGNAEGEGLFAAVQARGARAPRREAMAFQDRVPGLMEVAGFAPSAREGFGLMCLVGRSDEPFREALAQAPRAFRDFVGRNPLLAFLGWHPALQATQAGGDPVEAACRGRGDPLSVLSPGHARALRGRRPSDFVERGFDEAFRGTARLLAAVPPDWIPSGLAACRAFVDVAEAVEIAGHKSGRGSRGLVDSSKGDWIAFRSRCIAAAGVRDGGGLSRRELRQACLPIDDFPRHLARTLLLPLALRAGMPEGPAAVVARRVSLRLAYRDKGLPGVLEASRGWHEREPALRSAIPDGNAGDRPWAHAFEHAEIGDIAFVPLRTARDLDEEGAHGLDRNGVAGLAHCVATYRAKARAGASHIVSVRRRTPDGYERLATVELDQSRAGPARVLQAMGRGNAHPGMEATRATMVYANRVREAFQAKPVDAADYDWRDDALVERVLRAYEPLLPREMRGLGLDAFTRAVGFGEDAVAGPAP